jgi:3-methyladenine DNA glycosylase/8-oxoguanine DNA glycosylase
MEVGHHHRIVRGTGNTTTAAAPDITTDIITEITTAAASDTATTDIGTARKTAAADPRAIATNVAWYRHGRRDPTTWLGPTWMVRGMLTPDGPAAAKLEWSGGGARLEVHAWGPGADHAAAAMRAMAAGDQAPEQPVDGHRVVREAWRRHPHLRAGASRDLYHALLPTIIAQRITHGEAIRQWAVLVRRLGAPAPGPFPGLLLPPAPERLARMPTWWFHPLGIERKRAAALVSVARVAPSLWDWADLPTPAAVAARLALVPGVGPWTIGSVLGPVCGDDDAVALGDDHFPDVVAWNLAGEPRGDDRRMLELLEPYRPHRGRVLRLLGLVGRRPPAFGPKHRILPMHRF